MIAFLAFAARRAVVAAVLLVALTLATFVIFFRIPADPANFLLRDPQRATAEERGAARHVLGVDRPVHVQYLRYLRRLVHGDLGYAWSGASVGADGRATGVPVSARLDPALRVTGSIALGGFVVLLAVALPLGALAAARPGSWVDRATGAATLAGISLHPLVLGVVLQLVVAHRLGLVPEQGYCALRGTSVVVTPAGSVEGTCGGVESWASHLVLPWLTFAVFFVALYARMIRARMIEALAEPWTQTARAKGMGELRVVVRHALPNALPPVLAMLAMDVGLAAGVAVYVETVFNLPGLGRLLIQSLSGAAGFDLPVISGIVVVTAVVIIGVTFLADVLTAVVDPTIARGRRRGRGVLRATP